MENIKEYYRHLGRLAYAVAIADGKIQPEEREAVYRMVLKEFSHHEPSSDSSGMNKAFYTDFEFQESQKHPKDLQTILKEFSEFVETNYEPGDRFLLERCEKLLETVAHAYSKTREKLIIDTVRNKINQLLFI